MSSLRSWWWALPLTLLFLAVSALSAWMGVRLPVERALSAHMPAALSDAMRFSVNEQSVLRLVSQQIEADLGALETRGRVSVLRNCEIHLNSLDASGQADGYEGVNRWQRIPVAWIRGGRSLEAEFALHCQWHAPALFGFNLMLALLTMAVILSLPAAVGERELRVRKLLLGAGFDVAQVSQLVRQLADRLDTDTVRWLRCACRLAEQHGHDIEWVKAVAQAENTVTFEHDRHCVTIHGVEVTLSKTPYFYFAWYALLRLQGEGWVLNPASNRSDVSSAAMLIDLMHAHGGHKKAINELVAHGVRGKLLDQNRSKIKDELVAVLGEDLGTDYLFEAERDLRSGRYRYRLRVPPRSIFVKAA